MEITLTKEQVEEVAGHAVDSRLLSRALAGDAFRTPQVKPLGRPHPESYGWRVVDRGDSWALHNADAVRLTTDVSASDGMTLSVIAEPVEGALKYLAECVELADPELFSVRWARACAVGTGQFGRAFVAECDAEIERLQALR